MVFIVQRNDEYVNLNFDNTFFFQVEDKRLELEQQNTALSAKYRSLSTTHKITKKQLIELKVQLTVFLFQIYTVVIVYKIVYAITIKLAIWTVIWFSMTLRGGSRVCAKGKGRFLYCLYCFVLAFVK
jgi:hypothetical protein